MAPFQGYGSFMVRSPRAPLRCALSNLAPFGNAVKDFSRQKPSFPRNAKYEMSQIPAMH